MKLKSAILLGATCGIAATGGVAMADSMSEAIVRGGYNPSEDRFVSKPAIETLSYTFPEIQLVEKKDFDALKKRVEKLEEDHKKNPAKHGCVSLIEGLTLENRQDRLELRIKDVEKEVFGGPPKHYGF